MYGKNLDNKSHHRQQQLQGYHKREMTRVIESFRESLFLQSLFFPSLLNDSKLSKFPIQNLFFIRQQKWQEKNFFAECSKKHVTQTLDFQVCLGQRTLFKASFYDVQLFFPRGIWNQQLFYRSLISDAIKKFTC